MNQKQEVKSPVEDTKPEFIMTTSGVMVIGGELVGEKMTALICEAINHFNSDVAVVVLRNDGYPKAGDETLFGIAFPDTDSIAINVDRCWDYACEIAKEGKQNLGLMGLLWTNLLSTVAHELDHLTIAASDRELYEMMRSQDDGKDLEDSAHEAERQLICTLARDFDTEIPTASELGWLGLKIMALFTEEATKDEEWVANARRMMEAGIVYEEKDTEIVRDTFRQFVKEAYDQDGKAWEQATAPISLDVYMDDGTMKQLKAEEVPEPKAEVVDKEELEVADAIAEAGGTEPVEVAMVQQPGGMFVSAGAMVDGIDDDTPDTEPLPDDQVVADAENDPVMVDAGLSVPVPEPVAAQQQQFATAAATAVPQEQPKATTYAPNTLDPQVMPQVMELVWKTLYHHVFTKCGWQQNPTTGRWYFANAAAVLEGVNIQHILTKFGADNFVMEYDTLNAAGQPAAEQCQGMIRGYCTSKQGLPAYSIYLNIGGVRYKRTFLPQNPEKRNAQNAYSQSAQEAGAGHQIAWVFKDEVADAAPFKEKCAVKITNSVNGIVYEVIS